MIVVALCLGFLVVAAIGMVAVGSFVMWAMDIDGAWHD